MRFSHGALLTGVMVLGACSEPTISDLNNPAQDAYEVVSTRSQLESQAVGLADVDRRSHDFQILVAETMGRNFYRMDGAEPRYITQTLRGSLPSNRNFIGGAVFTGPYRTIRSAEFLIQGVQDAPDRLPEFVGGASVTFGARSKQAVIGYAQTFKALSYLRLIETRDTVGVPIYVGTDSLSPVRFKDDVLRYTSALLDSASTNLVAADTATFQFQLPVGFTGFTRASTFNRFTQALKARTEVYRAFDFFARSGTAADTAPKADRFANLAGVDQAALVRAQAALNASFFALNGSLERNGPGVFYTYAAGGDYLNPNYDQNIYRINPKVVTQAEGAMLGADSIWTSPDRRLAAKVELNEKDNCLARTGVRSCFLDRVNATNITPLAVIRNDELVLLQAEIFWGQLNFTQALNVVNIVRVAAGLPARTALSFGDPAFLSAASRQALLREILVQKRYQLLLESPARWVDHRMFGLLPDLGDERGFNARSTPILPIPLAERLARGNNVTKVDLP